MLRFSKQSIWPHVLTRQQKEQVVRQLLWPRRLIMMGELLVIPLVLFLLRPHPSLWVVVGCEIVVMAVAHWWPMAWLLWNLRPSDRIELSLPDEQLSDYTVLRPLLRRLPRQTCIGLVLFVWVLLLIAIGLHFDDRPSLGGVMGVIFLGGYAVVGLLDWFIPPPRASQWQSP